MAQARKVKAFRPTKRWTSIKDDGTLPLVCLARSKAQAEYWWPARRIVQVLITPITPRNRKAKK